MSGTHKRHCLRIYIYIIYRLHRSYGIRRVIIDTIWEFRWNKNDFIFFHETIEKSKSPTRGGGGTRASWRTPHHIIYTYL